VPAAPRIALLASAAWIAVSPSVHPSPIVTWFEADGAPRFSLGSLPAGQAAGAKLTTPIWNPRLPDLSVPLAAGGAVELAGTRGSVLVLDFWASWCAPCRQELPHLEELYRELAGAGLKAIAINVEEESQVALDAAKEMGLTLPIGVSGEEMPEALYREALPTILIVDRFGAIRQRYDGYRIGEEIEIARTVRELIAETAPPEREVASVVSGAGALKVLWTRDPPTSVDGLAVATGSGERGVLASLWRGITFFGADGRTVRESPAPRSRGELRSSTGDSALAFRPGGTGAVVLAHDGSVLGEISAAAALLDASSIGPDQWILATIDGVEIVGSSGERRHAAAVGAVGSVAVTDLGGDRGIAAVARDGRVLWLDATLSSVHEARRAEPGGKFVVGGPVDAGYGLLSPGVRSAAVGRFFDRDRGGLALAIDGSVVVLDLALGRVVFQALWPDLRAVAAGDVDGDGLDELVVAGTRRISVLTRSPATPPTAAARSESSHADEADDRRGGTNRGR